jgi:hypothetical protein
MRTYLHGAALLLVGIVAIVTPAALAASSSLETTYRQLMEDPKVTNPPPPQVYAGKTQKSPWTAPTPSESALTPYQECKATHTMDPAAGANCLPNGFYRDPF